MPPQQHYSRRACATSLNRQHPRYNPYWQFSALVHVGVVSWLANSFNCCCFAIPNYWGCQDDVARALPYCDSSLSIEDRLDDLISRLTLPEKVAMISPQPQLGGICSDHTANISRIGLPSYMWLVETNTAVATACLSPTKCATQFAGPLATAASFNRTSWNLKGEIFGTEQRAFMNVNGARGTDVHDYIGLTAFGPNINQQRDPRFGRSSELPGEDPVLAGIYAAHFVHGMQETDDQGYPKVIAYLKHFTAYSKEAKRGFDTYNITTFDLFDTYLPQYEIAFRHGHAVAAGVMCSYNGINGRPSCAHGYLLRDILRQRWHLPDAHVTSDCGAVHLLLGPPAYAPDAATAAAWALNNGTDLEMGSTVWTDHLVEAVSRNLTTEAAVDAALRRGYRPHFVAGRFDAVAASKWSLLGIDDIRTPYNELVRLEAALQGLVLLKNGPTNRAILPLPAGIKVAVLGPLAHTRAGLMSDYENDQSCFGGGHDCIPTLAESIRMIHGIEHTFNATGVDVDSSVRDGIAPALDLAQAADVVILCLGITKAQEHEGLDRTDTALPGLQLEFAQLVFATGTPVVLVLVNGGQVALEGLLDAPGSIIEAFNPNDIGGSALALTLFGFENRWGKLPYTLYPYETMQSFDMEDHSMTTAPGRTYRYYTGNAIFPFGFGLSYTSFEISCDFFDMKSEPIQQESKAGTTKNGTVQCVIANVGDMVGDEVVQLYHRVGTDIRGRVDHPVPIKRLVDFDRVRLEPGQKTITLFFLDDDSCFGLVNEHGDKVVYPGTHWLEITNGVMTPIEFEVHIGGQGVASALKH